MVDMDSSSTPFLWYVIFGRVLLCNTCNKAELAVDSAVFSGGLLVTAVMKFADNLLKGFAMAGY